MNMEYLQKLQLQRYEFFKSQNPETGRFDVIFEIEGKLLYAHRNMFTLVSDTFNAMLSERWNGNCDDAIKIEGNSFDDFFNFVHFCYSGSCELNADNIITMTDLAEFYNVNCFKKYCEEYALKMEFNLVNVFQLLEIAIKYSMDIFKVKLFEFIVSNFAQFVDTKECSTLDKPIFEELLNYCSDTVAPEDIFRFAYKWSEQQAKKKQEESNNTTFNLNEKIKLEISPFLPFIPFESMSMKFLVEFVVDAAFIFPEKQLKQILVTKLENYDSIKIKVTNSNHESLIGQVSLDDDVIQVIKNLNSDSGKYNSVARHYYFKTMLKAPPSTPSKIKKAEKDCWYLIYFPCGEIGFKKSCEIPLSYYIICEMIPKKNFSVTDKCNIEIYR